MPICDFCQKSVRKVEDWGQFNICKKCAEKTIKEKGDKTEKAFDMEIQEPRMIGGAQYDPKEARLIFRTKEEPTLYTWEDLIIHEFIHYLLHKHIGLRCCYQFDNIYECCLS